MELSVTSVGETNIVVDPINHIILPLSLLS